MKIYRGCIIKRGWITTEGRPQPDEWEWVHKDYGGPDDNRCGTAPTIDDAMRDIDERMDEREEERGSRCGPGCGWCGACS